MWAELRTSGVDPASPDTTGATGQLVDHATAVDAFQACTYLSLPLTGLDTLQKANTSRFTLSFRSRASRLVPSTLVRISTPSRDPTFRERRPPLHSITRPWIFGTQPWFIPSSLHLILELGRRPIVFVFTIACSQTYSRPLRVYRKKLVILWERWGLVVVYSLSSKDPLTRSVCYRTMLAM